MLKHKNRTRNNKFTKEKGTKIKTWKTVEIRTIRTREKNFFAKRKNQKSENNFLSSRAEI